MYGAWLILSLYLCAWEEGDLRTICWVQEVPFFCLSTLWPAHFSAGHAKCKLCENRQLDGCYAFISVTSGCIVAETGMINFLSIILLGLVIPPRIGLSMELAVGAMLILLGVFNVRSFFRSVPGPPEAAIHSHH